MNTIMHPNTNQSTNHPGKKETMSALLADDYQLRASQEVKDTAQQAPVTAKRKKSLFSLFLMTAIPVLIILCFAASDTLTREAYKALIVIFLLLQIKHFSNSINQPSNENKN